MQRSLLVLLLFVSTAIAACAGQSTTPSSSASSTSAVGANPNGCEVDAMKLCQRVATAPVTSGKTGLTMDSREREESAPRTAWEHVHTQTPAGTIVEVSCEINTQHSAVVSAQALKGAPHAARRSAWVALAAALMLPGCRMRSRGAIARAACLRCKRERCERERAG